MSEKSCQTDCLVTAFRIEQIANDNKLVHFYTGFEDHDLLQVLGTMREPVELLEEGCG